MSVTTDTWSPALNEAFRVRRRRAELHREIAALPLPEGMAALADVLDTLPEFMAGARLEDVLLWPGRMQTRRATQIRLRAQVFDSRSLGRLTVRQRGVLADALRGGERS